MFTNTLRYVLTLAFFVAALLTNRQTLKGQFANENPWGGSIPARTDSLAYERSPVEGFAWPTSVLPGETITFYVSVMNLPPEGQTYEMKIFRSPNWADGQELYTFPDTTGHFYPLRAADGDSIFPWQTPTKKPIDYRIGCKDFWSPTARTYTAPTTSGLYFARLNHLSINAESSYYYIPFIVRSANPGGSSKILYKYDWNTLQAYNYWGGGSLYSTGQDIVTLTPDSIIRFDRPLRRDFGRWITYVSALEKTLQDSGYSMEYCNNIDIDRDTTLSLLSHYSLLVLWNHDEYWSTNERSVIETFKGSPPNENFPSGLHGNLARFTANTCYWRITWDSTGDGKYLRLKCRKDNYGFPAYDKWRFPADSGGAGMPEAKFLGSQYETGGNDVDLYPETEQPPAKVQKPWHWVFRDAQLTTVDQEFGFGIVQRGRRRGLISGEVDNTLYDGITYNFPFPTLEVLAQRWVYSRVDTAPSCFPCNRYLLHQMIYYEDTLSNARVFGSGAIGGGWTYCLITDSGSVPDDVVRMKTITMNIISHFSGKKYIGNVWTSNPLTALEWTANVELDGNVQIPQGKYLRAISNTITVDSTFAINGTLEINGNVIVEGTGQLNLGATGEIKLMDGATLTLKARLNTANNVTLTVPSNTTLRVEQPAQLFFGSNSGLTVHGRLTVRGTSTTNVLFSTNTQSPVPNSWNYIALYGGPDTLEYCTVEYGTQGIYVNNSNTNIISNCTIRKCGWSGILGVNTTANYGGLIIQNTSCTENGRAIGLSNATADIVQSDLSLNNWNGVYQVNASTFLTSSFIQSNSYAGVHTSGSSIAIFSDRYGSPGHNTVLGNSTADGQNAGELTVNGGYAYIGYTDGEYYLWGCNTIDRGSGSSQYLIANNTNNLVYANNTYWGEKDPTDEDFYGPVDYAYWLSTPCVSNRPALIIGKGTGTPLLTNGVQPDTVRLLQLMNRCLETIQQRPDSANRYLPMLARLVGPTGMLSETRIGNWDNYLRNVRGSSRRAAVAEICNSLILQNKLHKRNYAATIAFADSLLTTNPTDRLWILSQASKMSSYLAGADTTAARQLLSAIRERGNRIDSEMVALFGELISIETQSRRLSPSLQNNATKLQSATEVQPVPIQFMLSQNYPNPFNPTTTINYDIPTDVHVSLKLYDILGREVLALINEKQQTGYHQVTVDGTSLSSGVYFYRMNAGQFSSTKKMLLLK